MAEQPPDAQAPHHFNMATNPPKTPFDLALNALGVTLKGDATRPDEGLIASNYFIDTQEQGPLVIRINNLEPEEAGAGPGFEARALRYLTTRNMKVPRLVSFTDGTIEQHLGDKRAIAYQPIMGDTLSVDDVDSPAIAQSAGALLAELIAADEQYTPDGSEPDGDAAFVLKITDEFVHAHPQFSDNSFFGEARALLAEPETTSRIESSPQGIVHADYFYENIVVDKGEFAGVIDFGDAYYGGVLSDIVIGAMEFSILEESEAWRPELFRAFLSPNAAWLKANKIDYATFETALLVNCVRFAVYTLGFELEDNPQAAAESNRYVQRFYRFRDELRNQAQTIFNETVNQ